MIKSLLQLAVILVVGILIYNYFLGTAEEKEQSEKVFESARDLGKSAWDLLKSEKEKFDEGKYDQALDKINSLISSMKDKAEKIQDSEILDKISDLEKQKRDLEKKINESDQGNSANESQQADIKDDWKNLIDETESLMNEFEDGGN